MIYNQDDGTELELYSNKNNNKIAEKKIVDQIVFFYFFKLEIKHCL